jgi:hypothetical protein
MRLVLTLAWHSPPERSRPERQQRRLDLVQARRPARHAFGGHTTSRAARRQPLLRAVPEVMARPRRPRATASRANEDGLRRRSFRSLSFAADAAARDLLKAEQHHSFMLLRPGPSGQEEHPLQMSETMSWGAENRVPVAGTVGSCASTGRYPLRWLRSEPCFSFVRCAPGASLALKRDEAARTPCIVLPPPPRTS